MVDHSCFDFRLSLVPCNNSVSGLCLFVYMCLCVVTNFISLVYQSLLQKFILLSHKYTLEDELPLKCMKCPITFKIEPMRKLGFKTVWTGLGINKIHELCYVIRIRIKNNFHIAITEEEDVIDG